MLRPSRRVRSNDRRGNSNVTCVASWCLLPSAEITRALDRDRTSWDGDAHVQVVLSEAVGDGIQPTARVQVLGLCRIVEHTL